MARPIVVDLPTARAALKRAVDFYGQDYNPRRRLLVDNDGEPVDLVGVALVDIGIEGTSLRRWAVSSVYTLSDGLRRAGIADFTEAAEQYFEMAQEVGDEFKTWGEAYAAAEGMVVEA